jgi:hypothetical protein
MIEGALMRLSEQGLLEHRRQDAERPGLPPRSCLQTDRSRRWPVEWLGADIESSVRLPRCLPGRPERSMGAVNSDGVCYRP